MLNPGHCGITVAAGSKLDVGRNIVTGSKFHALRCTGGTLLAHDNLIIKNQNRGIYLGNKSASGRISNNVISECGTGISGFAQSEVAIEHNVILDCGYAGLDARDSCRLTVRDNIFSGNPRGILLVKESGKNRLAVGRNTYWNNPTPTENLETPGDSILADPQFVAPQAGDFTARAEEVVSMEQGLSDPAAIQVLWSKWEQLQSMGNTPTP